MTYSLCEFEQYVLNVIEEEHPEWVEPDGSCPRCVHYYQSLDHVFEPLD